MQDFIAGSPVARGVLTASFIAFVVAEVSVRLRNPRPKGSALVDRGSLLAVVAGIVAGSLLAGWFLAKTPAFEIPGNWIVLGLSVVLIWSGIALRQWAVFSLGRFFTIVVTLSAGQHAVADGPFRWVRHPSYSGLLLTLSGVGVAFGNWLSLAALVLLPAVGLAVRIHVEETALLRSLEGYREYAEGKPRLVPWVW